MYCVFTPPTEPSARDRRLFSTPPTQSKSDIKKRNEKADSSVTLCLHPSSKPFSFLLRSASLLHRPHVGMKAKLFSQRVE